MDIPFGAWLPELDMEEYPEFMYHLQQTPSYTDQLVDSFSSPYFNGCQNVVTRDHHSISGVLDTQVTHTANATSSLFAPITGSSTKNFTISFGDFTSPTTINQNELHDEIKCNGEMNIDEVFASIELPKKVSSTRRNHSQAQEHVLAERRRREKLTQRFTSLYTLLPETKKMDKATVLEDACKYIKHLQNRVKQLEETSMSKKNVIQETNTAASTRKSKFHELAYASSFNATNNPEIKVRILGCNVLLRIYYDRNSLLPLKALTEMEGLHFTIICSSVLPISSTFALITIIAQTSEEFAVTSNDLVKCLQLSFSKLR